MKMTTQPPTVPGYYWWTNLGEHTPTIMNVVSHGSYLYAGNGEYEFSIDPDAKPVTEPQDPELDDEPLITIDGVDYYYGTEFWAGPIPLPELAGNKIEPDSF